MLRLSRFSACSLIGLGIFSLLLGCGSSSSPSGIVADANNSNIKRLSNLYSRFQSDHNWVGPKDESALRDYINNEVPDFIKERINLTNADEIFVSERDGKPFKIQFEVLGSPKGCSKPAIFEAEGASGKRMVGFLNMTQREVDEQEYNELWEGKAE